VLFICIVQRGRRAHLRARLFSERGRRSRVVMYGAGGCQLVAAFS